MFLFFSASSGKRSPSPQNKVTFTLVFKPAVVYFLSISHWSVNSNMNMIIFTWLSNYTLLSKAFKILYPDIRSTNMMPHVFPITKSFHLGKHVNYLCMVYLQKSSSPESARSTSSGTTSGTTEDSSEDSEDSGGEDSDNDRKTPTKHDEELMVSNVNKILDKE